MCTLHLHVSQIILEARHLHMRGARWLCFFCVCVVWCWIVVVTVAAISLVRSRYSKSRRVLRVLEAIMTVPSSKLCVHVSLLNLDS